MQIRPYASPDGYSTPKQHGGRRLFLLGLSYQYVIKQSFSFFLSFKTKKELWTLLNFIDPLKFSSLDDFLEEFGDLKEADQVSKLHTLLRPYLLRRMKEDVEKSIPAKEETIVEVPKPL